MSPARRSQQLRGSGGSEIAETAIIMPLLFMMVLAIFWFGQAFHIYTTITQAARQGARAAIAPACSTCTPVTNTIAAQNAITAINSTLAAAHMATAQIQAPSPVPTLCPCGSTTSSCGSNAISCASIHVTTNVCVQPNVQLSYSSLGGAGSCGTSVSFGYKNGFNFTIPFTELNLGTMNLPAQAQMRLETQ
ncbi:MAG TPA: TadE family protein [Candidatus Aquilonibacter sp.]|nr:TadE family protein [Candidatus Aquilonibacter sp.]